MEEHNPRLKMAILQLVSNQLRMNDPPETKAMLNRQISEGYSKQDAKELIGAVVSAHIYEMLKEQHNSTTPNTLRIWRNYKNCHGKIEKHTIIEFNS